MRSIAGNLLRLAFVLCTTFSLQSSAQVFTSLASFSGNNGAAPTAALVQGPDGNFYSTTIEPFLGGQGNVYKVSPNGTISSLYNFCSQPACADGQSPEAPLFLAPNGAFYGTTFSGGTGLNGTVFKITLDGTETVLYSFCKTDCSDGSNPVAGLVQAPDGEFFGMTQLGGNPGPGTIFKIRPSGKLTTIYSFCASRGCPDGEEPTTGLIRAKDGNFYGVTPFGGPDSKGTVFKVSAAGVLTTLHSFTGTDGDMPVGPLVQGPNGHFYGVTETGGNETGPCTTGCGTIFRITAQGAFTVLHKFDSSDGAYPGAGLILGTDGNYYGTTASWGANGIGAGTMFQMSPNGSVSTLYSFCSETFCADGNSPAGLLQATNGTFYGVTAQGGLQSNGTVFSLSMGLSPFVKTVPTAGKAGTKVVILGNNLTGTTSVTFNGVAASFTVVSDTQISASVPPAATTGTVSVVTPSGTLNSVPQFVVGK